MPTDTMNRSDPNGPTPGWDGFLHDPTFTGRQAELAVLRSVLLAPEARAVCLSGDAGMGKTTLAMVFGRSHQDFFTAGVYHVHAKPFHPLTAAVEAHVSHPANPYLLILDDVDTRRVDDVRAEIQALKRQRPSARLIYIARQQAPVDPGDRTIRLAGLDHTALKAILAKASLLGRNTPMGDALIDALAGNARATWAVADLLHSGRMSPRDVLQALRDFAYSGIVDASGNPIATDGPAPRQIIVDVESVNDALLQCIAADPDLVHALSPRKFEEFVAEVLARLGYDVQVTPASRDGGVDIYAARKDHLGSFLYLVECKKYAPHRSVGVGLIRSLHGVVQAKHATAGIVATTSFFTKGAKEFQQSIPHQMALTDFLGIQHWLKDVFLR
jgi:restriction system protein